MAGALAEAVCPVRIRKGRRAILAQRHVQMARLPRQIRGQLGHEGGCQAIAQEERLGEILEQGGIISRLHPVGIQKRRLEKTRSQLGVHRIERDAEPGHHALEIHQQIMVQRLGLKRVGTVAHREVVEPAIALFAQCAGRLVKNGEFEFERRMHRKSGLCGAVHHRAGLIARAFRAEGGREIGNRHRIVHGKGIGAPRDGIDQCGTVDKRARRLRHFAGIPAIEDIAERPARPGQLGGLGAADLLVPENAVGVENADMHVVGGRGRALPGLTGLIVHSAHVYP